MRQAFQIKRACQSVKLISFALCLALAACTGKQTGVVLEDTAGKTPDELLIQPYPSPVKIHTVLSYRESEDPRTPKGLTPETASAIRFFKERLNIDLVYDWIVNTDQFDAKFGAELAAGNLPDLMYLTPTQFDDLYQQGGLADLTEVWNAYANSAIQQICNYDGKLINSVTREGKIYGLPMSIYPGQKTSQTYYRMDYLKKAGVTSPDQLPKTIREFEALCEKLMKTDFRGDGKTGGALIPGNMRITDTGLADFSPVFHAYGAAPAIGFVNDGSGKLTYSGLLPEVAAALAKLAEWYQKGYFSKDFAAADVWAANAPVVSDIVAGKYPIVFGSWWIPNWPLNMNKSGQPDADWVVGPTLTVDGKPQSIFVPRYPIDHVVAVSKDCKNPEAIFKLMNMSLDLLDWHKPGWDETATQAQLTEKYSYVYIWLPYRTYSPITLVENQQYLSALESAGKFTMEAIGELPDAPRNDEFNGVFAAYIKWYQGDHSGPVWGNYYSRVARTGGVARMYQLYSSAPVRYDEVYVNTPSMVAYKSELDRLQRTALIQIIMGEHPLGYLETFKSQWLAQGGRQILEEVNDWYAKTGSAGVFVK